LVITSRENHRLRVFEIKVLKMVFGSRKDDEVRRDWKMELRSFIICTWNQILLGRLNQGGC